MMRPLAEMQAEVLESVPLLEEIEVKILEKIAAGESAIPVAVAE